MTEWAVNKSLKPFNYGVTVKDGTLKWHMNLGQLGWIFLNSFKPENKRQESNRQPVGGSSPVRLTLRKVCPSCKSVLLALSHAHLGQKPGDPFLNPLTSSTRDLENFHPFVYPSDCLGKGIGIELQIW